MTVITTRSSLVSGEYVGLTASSFNSLSLDPPLVLWSLARYASSLPHFTANSHYVINVLGSDQYDLALRFSSRALFGKARFDGVPVRECVHGAPVLAGCQAWFACYNRSRYEEGDHVIFVGEVERCGFVDKDALVFHGGAFHVTQPHPGT